MDVFFRLAGYIIRQLQQPANLWPWSTFKVRQVEMKWSPEALKLQMKRSFQLRCLTVDLYRFKVKRGKFENPRRSLTFFSLLASWLVYSHH